MKKIYCNIFNSLFISLILPLSTANAQRVEIVGETDCFGVYSETCGWGDYGDNGGGDVGWTRPGSEGGGGGGEAPGSNNDNWTNNDGTKGKAQVNRYVAGCLREALFLADIQSNAAAGFPQGIVLFENKDPAFEGEYWVKYAADLITHRYNAVTKQTVELRSEVHYMYNRATEQVAQVKFKTSFEWACEGIPIRH